MRFLEVLSLVLNNCALLLLLPKDTTKHQHNCRLTEMKTAVHVLLCPKGPLQLDSFS